MEDFEKKVKITEAMDVENGADSLKTLQLLRRFLQIQQRRAQAYANLRRYPCIFLCLVPLKYMISLPSVRLFVISFLFSLLFLSPAKQPKKGSIIHFLPFPHFSVVSGKTMTYRNNYSNFLTKINK